MRTRAPDLPVAPAPSHLRSRSSTFRAPSRVRWKAVLVPLAPPPTMTTSALAIASLRLSVYSAAYPIHPEALTEAIMVQVTPQWTFKIRPGVKWHTGDPFTAADAKFSLERTWDPKIGTRVSTVFTTIDRIEALDPSTLVIHTKKPDPLLPARLAFYGGQIVPKKYVEASGNDTFNAKPVGTGPVRFVSWVKDDKLTVEGYPDYFGGKPDFDRLIVRAIPETAPRVAALLKGEIDIITQLPPDQGERVAANPATRVAGALYARLYVLSVNSKRPPLDNPLVKQALSLAIDRA